MEKEKEVIGENEGKKRSNGKIKNEWMERELRKVGKGCDKPYKMA